MFQACPFPRTFLQVLSVAAGIMAMQLSASAEAHRYGGGWHRGGWFVGGLVVGAALAPRYVAPAPYYYPPVAYSPPPVVYTQPRVIYSQPQVIYSQPRAIYSQPQMVYNHPHTLPPPPAAVVPSVQGGQSASVENRLYRLKSLCDQKLLTAQECQTRRGQILREL